MDGTDSGQEPTTQSRPASRRIGIIGTNKITNEERAIFVFIGRAIARLGHTLVCIPAKGVVDAVREGVEVEGGEIEPVTANVLAQADHTLLYLDPQLQKRLQSKYPNYESRSVTLNHNPLTLWVEAIQEILSEYNLPIPE